MPKVSQWLRRDAWRRDAWGCPQEDPGLQAQDPCNFVKQVQMTAHSSPGHPQNFEAHRRQPWGRDSPPQQQSMDCRRSHCTHCILSCDGSCWCISGSSLKCFLWVSAQHKPCSQAVTNVLGACQNPHGQISVGFGRPNIRNICLYKYFLI